MANSLDPDQTAPIGAVCSGSTLFASILNSSVMLGNYLQQTTSADDIFRCIFFLGALRASTAVALPTSDKTHISRNSLKSSYIPIYFHYLIPGAILVQTNSCYS